MSLLDLMHEALFGMTSLSQRKMFFKVHILYIDEGRAVYGWSQEFWEKQIEMIKEACEKKYGFTYTIIPIEAIFDVDPNVLDLKTPNAEEMKKLEEEKKEDYENHTALPDNFEEVANKHLHTPDLEIKRENFN